MASPGGRGSDAIKQAGFRTAARRSEVRFTESGAWRFFAASSRQAREPRSGHACRVPRRRAFGRGFDSRRLHHSKSFYFNYLNGGRSSRTTSANDGRRFLRGADGHVPAAVCAGHPRPRPPTRRARRRHRSPGRHGRRSNSATRFRTTRGRPACCTIAMPRSPESPAPSRLCRPRTW